MTQTERKKLYGFFENELTNQILSFWMPRCEDKEYGGFINCFDNKGEKLASYDKYTWSQGRFVWMFARLAGSPAVMFTKEERDEFLRLAKQGADFLEKHCLMGEDDWRCVFLMNRDGSPKRVEGWEQLDMSIYADCFAVIGMARYALESGDIKKYEFAKKLHESCVNRVNNNSFNTLPYPLSAKYRAHGIPMIMSNTTKELCLAADKLDTEYGKTLRELVKRYTEDILDNFVDENNVMHEIIMSDDNSFFPQILGQHMNPGHTIEDAWFMLEACDLCRCPQWEEKIYDVAETAFKNGWDETYGGLLHFCGVNGGEPVGDMTGVENETMTKQLLDWDSKLWWVHSEALYTSLLCHLRSGDEKFLKWFERVFEYTFNTFPGKNPEVREWIQIRSRDGSPQEKVVALPVKDPFHITRNIILILEALYNE
ncbi:MAG: AGE family epimerase/isomerase [Oscillospiraceae bacterium]|nr:AGE family epimerase/isomerase [Oscillospiraceae bacterium]